MKQGGFISMSSLLLFSIVGVIVAILGLRLVPPYIEFLTLQKTLSEIANDPEVHGGTPQDIRTSFNKRAQVNDIKAVSANDIEISRDGGDLVLSVSYPVKIEMVGNISVCIDFAATTARGG